MRKFQASFEVLYLKEAKDFLEQIDQKARRKILYNISRAVYESDPSLFKKISENVWEFRTRYNMVQYRLFAFWDKRDSRKTLVIATHGIVKKSKKVPAKEIAYVKRISAKYLYR